MIERNREEWLIECAELIMLDIISCHWKVRANFKYKVSVGYAPNTKTSSNTVGCCLSMACSSKGFNEIFISPIIKEIKVKGQKRSISMMALETLVHELVHAVDDCKSNHQGDFAKLARACGLAGKLTASYAGEALEAQLQDYIDVLGPIPHHTVDLSSQPKQVNRNIKVWCQCGFKFNTSRTQIKDCIESAGEISCPKCASSMIYDV